MSRFDFIYNIEDIPSYITPLFWQHGEAEDTLRDEIRQMSENGIGGFIVESRPHPDFFGVTWWRDIDIILDEAGKRNMKVWFFDDALFPSGFAAGKIRDNHPEFLKVYMDEKHIDALGPINGSSFLIDAWLNDDEKVICVVAARRIDGLDRMDEESLLDVTEKIVDGILYWDVPEGDWRIFIFISTRSGGEEYTKDYLNPIDAEPVREFINYIYEEYYERYSDEFGKTIAGFFSDEPRLGNGATYEGTLGSTNMTMPYQGNSYLPKMVLPYSDKLLPKLNESLGEDIKRFLPCLWYEAGSVSAKIRFIYMDIVSKLFGENYTQQIGDWCRGHGVKYIGHVVEDNGAHARLGFGNGHFFRALKGQDYSGLDIVYQVWPEHSDGRFTTPFGYLDADFFYWGLTKMASSAAHIDPKKEGITVCEVFGAYGWQEGLKLMKWLTDHICVRGVNFIIPHAFSPIYPDPDCPPHFYARGANPQWRYFNLWSGYANRLCHILTGGRHVAPVAVVYHAEAEWAGKYMPFEKVVKALAIEQIDCDVIPIDAILDRKSIRIDDRRLIINNEEYKAIIVPYAQRLPEDFVRILLELAKAGIYIIFIEGYPEDSSKRAVNFPVILEDIKQNLCTDVSTLDALADKLKSFEIIDIEVTYKEKYLRNYHYVNEGTDIFFFTNESIHNTINTTVRIKTEDVPTAYDVMNNKLYKVDYSHSYGFTSFELVLEPYESLLILSGDEMIKTDGELNEKVYMKDVCNECEIKGPWEVSLAEADQYPHFKREEKINGLGNIALPGLLPKFSGTLRYKTEFHFAKTDSVNKVYLDPGNVYEIFELWVNGRHAGIRICPPYWLEITDLITDGKNSLCIDITNTLAKKHGNNIFDRAMPQEPSGLVGPVKLKF